MGTSARVEVRGLSGFIANVRAADRTAQAEIRAAVRGNGERQHNVTVAECPKDTGYMASKTVLEFTPGGLNYSIGYREEDFPGAFYPQFVIHGTHKMAANDFLFRVHEMLAAENTRTVGDAVRRSIQRYR